MKRLYLTIIGAGVACTMFALFVYVRSNVAARRPTAQTVTIGWVGPLSGPVSFLGVENEQAFRLAIEDYNLHKQPSSPEVQFISKDDRYDTAIAKQDYDILVNQNRANIVILSSYSAMFALADSILHDNVIVVNPIDNDAQLAQLNRNIFTIAKRTEDMATTIADELIAQKKKQISIVYFSGDQFMPTLTHSLQDSLERRGAHVALFNYRLPDDDLNGYLASSKQLHADAYVFLGYSDIGRALVSARQLDTLAPFYTVNTSMAETAGSSMEGVRYLNFTAHDGNEALAQAFEEKFAARYGKKPQFTWTALQAYDAAQMLLSAIPNASKIPTDFVANLRQDLLNFRQYPGVSGELTMQPDGTISGIHWSLYTYSSH